MQDRRKFLDIPSANLGQCSLMKAWMQPTMVLKPRVLWHMPDRSFEGVRSEDRSGSQPMMRPHHGPDMVC